MPAACLGALTVPSRIRGALTPRPDRRAGLSAPHSPSSTAPPGLLPCRRPHLHVNGFGSFPGWGVGPGVALTLIFERFQKQLTHQDWLRGPSNPVSEITGV